MSAPSEGNLAVEPEWRREVSSRLRDYRVRRHGAAPVARQSTLPFEEDAVSSEPDADDALLSEPLSPAGRPNGLRKQRAERYEISIPIHEPPATLPQMGQPANGHHGFGSADGSRFPVASLSERRRAALLDAALLLFSYGGMLALFTVLGGRIGWNKLDAVVAAATLALFYAQYFALFTIFGGSTPGMMVCGLRVVSFEGSVPTSRQMSWRSLGYMISAGTCFLGFLWALWDEDHFSWHDRISQTYLTQSEGFAHADPSPEA